MRQTILQRVLPLFFCLLPVLAALLIVAALPAPVRVFYVEHLQHPSRAAFDYLILTLGAALFILQTQLAYAAFQLRGTGFDERPDRYLTNLAQASEWFPLLGLIGTVANILRTFIEFKANTPFQQVLTLYAPAITATGSGLFMALLNILPTWTVLIGRDLLRTQAGGPAPLAPGEPPAAAKPAARDAVPASRP